MVSQSFLHLRQFRQVFRFPLAIPDRPADLERLLEMRPGAVRISALPIHDPGVAETAGQHVTIPKRAVNRQRALHVIARLFPFAQLCVGTAEVKERIRLSIGIARSVP